MNVATDPAALYRRYQELQTYVGWTEDDARRMHAVGPVVEPSLTALINDFYDEIERHPEALKVITGGKAQIERLKGTLANWIRELFSGKYDGDYVVRRWRVGRRHVEIGLDQVYTNVALSRLRIGLLHALHNHWQGEPVELKATVRSLNKLLDLDLATIEDAYQAEYVARQQRAERLAAIGQVAGGIAHELRNPLNVMRTSAYFLRNAVEATAEKKLEHLHRLERQVILADSIITALSNFARMPVPHLRPLNVRKCLEESLEASPAAENCRVTVECPSTLSEVQADPDQLRIVIGNLVRNACEAMPEGGQLTLTASHVGDNVELAITDTGTGIAPEQLSRIMEPLYSTKARGLGLGLAIARAILEKNKGSMRVVSEPGRGSSFIVQLLAVQQKERSAP